jgi:hypothetical protein
MPPFGFGGKNDTPYDLKYQVADPSGLPVDGCNDDLTKYSLKAELCSSFGSRTSFYILMREGDSETLSRYVPGETGKTRISKIAEIDASVKSISFMHSIDTPGGSITIILNDNGTLYRAYLDVSTG